MRTYVFIFAVFVIAVLENSQAKTAPKLRGDCMGCPVDQDPDNPENLNMLKKVLTENLHINDSVKKIIRMTTQVVSGIVYDVDFELEDGSNCKITWLEQGWITDYPSISKFVCT